MITKEHRIPDPEMNFIRIMQLFDVNHTRDLERGSILHFNHDVLLSLCAVLEVGFQTGVLQKVPERFQLSFIRALDQERSNEQSILLVDMFYNRLRGNANELYLERSVGFSDYASFLAFARDLHGAQNINLLRTALCEDGPERLVEKIRVRKWVMSVEYIVTMVTGGLGNRLVPNKAMSLREGLSETIMYINDMHHLLFHNNENIYFKSMVWHYFAPRLIYVTEESNRVDEARDRLAQFWRLLIYANVWEREDREALSKIEGAYRTLEKLRAEGKFLAEPLLRAIRFGEDGPAPVA